jgi:GMP synthase-like glutamine amidotransferase
MGGPMNIYETEKYSWLAKEKLFLQTCLAAKKKMLGVCLGSQLLADALGAKVFPNKEKEIGWFPIHINGNHPLLNVFPEDVIPAFHWHGDTFEIPRNAIPIFYSEATKNQGFVFDNHVFALQFHWEIEPGSLKQLTQHASGDLTSGKYIQTVDKMLNNASGFESSRHHLWGLLNFIQAL